MGDIVELMPHISLMGTLLS